MSSTGQEQCIVQLNTDDPNNIGSSPSWVSQVKRELTELPKTRSAESKRWKKYSIYRVPQSAKELCMEAYQPQTVSIGPYHHGEPQLQGMEEHKQRGFLTFLERSKKPLECYRNALAPVVEDLAESYQQLQAKWREDREAFLRVMIVDGCFVLEIMRAATAKAAPVGYAENDPVFSKHGKLGFVPYVMRDMLMLENQLPLMVLSTLLFVEDGGVLMSDGFSTKEKLSMLVLEFFCHRQQEIDNKIEEYETCAHILDLYRRSMLLLGMCREKTQPNKRRISDCLPGPGPGPRASKNGADKYIRSATELKESGIKFKKSNTCHLNNISFHRGTLRLPWIVVDDVLESQYLNMIAYERLHVGAGNEVTEFAFFMDNIIDNDKDVGLLHSSKIIQNAVGSDKAAADMFNKLSRDVTLDPDGALGVVQTRVAEYCEELVPKWMAYAKHNYFTNPWVSLSIFAAIFLFVLTGIQTVYSILGYYFPKN